MEYQRDIKSTRESAPFDILPERVKRAVLEAKRTQPIEEIRLRVDRPIELVFSGSDRLLSVSPGALEFKQILTCIFKNSIYSYEDDIMRGFVTLPCGSRVGLAGKVVSCNGKIQRITDISALNIRIPREIKGIGGRVLSQIVSNDTSLLSTLLISPPSGGKTTLLRDMARMLSDGFMNMRKKVVIIDERSELAACSNGVATYDVGMRTDVLDGCQKSDGMLMAIRSLSPDVLITDEIGTLRDLRAIETAISAGVTVIASAHGRSYSSFKARVGALDTAFEKVILLKRENGESFFAVDEGGSPEFKRLC